MDGEAEGVNMSLASGPASTYYAYMGRQEDAVRTALEAFPGSIRTLAAAAGVSEGLLRAIRDGRRSATPRVVGFLAYALEQMAKQQTDAARILKDSLLRKEDA